MTVHGMHREASIEIHASPDAVYDLVADLPRMGEWSPENIGGEWQGGGSGKMGDRFIGHNRAGERTADGSRQARPRHLSPGQPCQQARQWPETRTVTSGDAPLRNVENAYDRPWYAS